MPKGVTSLNIKNENGGLVHTDVVSMDQINIQKGETVSETHSQMFAHFVKVRLYFMNREFIEEYPIQDQDYSAARVFNQNLVNRALQRAKAKVASRATGLGFKLYEGKDLQFDEVPVETKPEIPVVETKNAQSEEKKSPKKDENAQKSEKTVQKVEEKQVETQSNVETKVEEPVKAVEEIKEENKSTSVDAVIAEAVALIKETPEEKITPALQKVNVSLMKKHQIAISPQKSDEELIEILSNKNIFKDPSQFVKTLKLLIG